jgi:hypothetical protein
MLVFRFDNSKIDGHRFSSEGFLIVDLRIARTGLQTYAKPDGSPQIEFRPEEEVFAQEALDSFKGKLLTILHPPKMLNPENWKPFTIGHIGDDVRKDGDWMVASGYVIDKNAIDRIIKGDLQELSGGYWAEMDSTPGDLNGCKYDVIQRKITGNHVALGPKGFARAGRDARIVLDSEGSVIIDSVDSYRNEYNEETMKFKIIIDGINYEIEASESTKEVLDRFLSASEESKAKNDALKSELDETKKRLDSALDPKHLADLARNRANLISKAEKLSRGKLSKSDCSDLEIMIEALEKSGRKVSLDGKNDTYKSVYVCALFDAACESVQEPDQTKEINKAISSVAKSDSSPILNSIEKLFDERFKVSK